MKLIKTDKISYSYPIYEDETDNQETAASYKALDAVDLEIEKGQFICILGNNGSGKSTLARHLNALLIPDEGTVWINGKNTADENNQWDIRSEVGMVFQNPDNQMVASRVDEEIAFGPENLGIPSEEIIIRVEEALNAVEMEKYELENPVNLSGGQKQRIAIAGILAMRPQCIVLDESTAMLDPRGRKEIMDAVLKLHRENGITLICITHFMEEAVLADQVFVMSNGKILLKGKPKKVFSKNKEIEEAHLLLPIICQLANELRMKGMNIPEDIITGDELKKYIDENYT